ncbi:MAG: ABC transporter permease [Candidatus Dormibacteraceae bacterium]
MAYRELVYNLAVRDLRLKYKRSTIGIVWSLLNPLFMMIIYTVAFSYILHAANTHGRPYWTLVMGGLLAWFFFANAVGSAPVTFVHSSNLVSRLYFPIEALPIATVLANFVNFLISLVLLLIALLLVDMPLGLSLVLLPVILLAQLAFTIGIALCVATLTVYFRDLEHLVGIGLNAFFYLTPVLYVLNPEGLPGGAGTSRILPYLKLNPMAWFLDSYHAVLYYGSWPDPKQFSLMLLAAVISLVGGYMIFIRLRARLPEEV